jgi:hypothetical protein
VGEDVGECSIEMAGELDCGQGSGGTVGGGAKGEDCAVAPVYDFASVAFEEDFAHEFGACVGGGGGIGEMPRRVEGFCESKVLFCYYSAGDTLLIVS